MSWLPPTGAQVIRRPRCPVCDTTNVQITRSDEPEKKGGPRVRYYRCRECQNLHAQKATTFKVVVL